MSGVAIEADGGLRAGAARGHQRAHAAVGFADQPETVAADVIHVRIDGGDRRSHGDHGLDGVAAFGEDGTAVFDGDVMRRGDDAAAVAGTMQIHGGFFLSSRPRACGREPGPVRRSS